MNMCPSEDAITSVVITNTGDAHKLQTTSGSYYYTTSTKPIFVSHLAMGGQVDTGGDGKEIQLCSLAPSLAYTIFALKICLL